MGCQDCEGVSRNCSDEQSQCTHVRPEVAELIRGFDVLLIESVSFHRDCLRILLCVMPSIIHLEESAFRLCFKQYLSASYIGKVLAIFFYKHIL